jgi:hypothetical protein
MRIALPDPSKPPTGARAPRQVTPVSPHDLQLIRRLPDGGHEARILSQVRYSDLEVRPRANRSPGVRGCAGSLHAGCTLRASIK